MPTSPSPDHYIQNYPELATTPERVAALDILAAGYQAIATDRIMDLKIKLEGDDLKITDSVYNLATYRNIYVVSVGKCALAAARKLEAVLGERITDGLALDISRGELKTIRSLVGTHPLPSEANVEATRQITELLEQTTKDDLVITIISGGGSALLCQPYEINVEALIRITQQLTKQGANIHELNTIRKHLSEIKGGQLAKLARPAEVVSLIFSDVPGDDLSVIASGPTVRDQTTTQAAEAIWHKYELSKQLGEQPTFIETPKDSEIFKRVKNILLVTNHDAVLAMEERARQLNYNIVPGSLEIAGEARQVGRQMAESELQSGQVKICAGETTVTIEGNGQGGRNQEVALGALNYLNAERILIAAASDGQDNTDAAGALSDQKLLHSAHQLSLDPDEYLVNNDSYHFFRQTGGAIITGPTGSNVADLFILLSK